MRKVAEELNTAGVPTPTGRTLHTASIKAGTARLLLSGGLRPL